MASKVVASSTILLLALNLFLSLVSSTDSPPPSASPHKPESPPHSSPTPKTPSATSPSPTPETPPTPPSVAIPPIVSKPPITPPILATPPTVLTPPGVATPPTAASPHTSASCPGDALKLGSCANVLEGLIGQVLGTPSKEPCCGLLNGLTDTDAAVCLCTAIKANVLGINPNVPVNVLDILNHCDKKVPDGFKCE